MLHLGHLNLLVLATSILSGLPARSPSPDPESTLQLRPHWRSSLPISFLDGFRKRLGEIEEIRMRDIDGNQLGMVLHHENRPRHVGSEGQHFPDGKLDAPIRRHPLFFARPAQWVSTFDFMATILSRTYIWQNDPAAMPFSV